MTELFFGKFASDKWHDVVSREEERCCRSVANREPSGAVGIAFPSEWYIGAGGMIRDTDIVHAPGGGISYSAASLIMCVNYKGPPATHYQTQAWFGLYENNSVLVAVGVDADAARLRLVREESGDHAY